MSRPYTPGGRFDAEFETNEILDAISKDLTTPVGSTVLWYVFVGVNDTSVATAGRTVLDPVYDVGGVTTAPYIPSTNSGGRRWRAGVEIPVVRAVISQGQSQLSDRGFYNADLLHLTIDRDEMTRRIPDVLDDPDPLNRDRVLWKGQIYKPYKSQEQGIVSERFTIVSFDCQQVMPEEMINDPQFQAYAK